MRLLLILFFALFISACSQTSHAAQSYGYALVSDKDGYVNLRSDESLNSNIIRKLPNGTVLSANCVDYTSNKNFCFIITDNYVKGYVYKDRLSFFADNKSLVNVPIINNNPLVANFANNKHSIKASIEIKPVKVDVSKISNTNKEACPTLYKGICSYGLNDDNQTPSNYYKFSDITFYLDNKKITVPKENFKNIYIPEYAVTDREIFNAIELYFNPTNNKIYLLSMQAGGAVTYSVVFEIGNSKQIKRYTWSEVS